MSALFADGVTTRQRASEVSGRGVGLAAVQAACRRHGATVRVTSEPDRGALFELTTSAANGKRPSLPAKSYSPLAL